MTDFDSATRDALRKAQASLQKRDVAGTEHLCRAILTRYPDCSDAHYLLALAYAATGNVAVALGSFEAALSVRRHWAYWLDYARLLASIGRIAEANSAYRHALQGGPGNPAIVLELAGLLRNQGRLAEAEALLAEFLAHWPDDADVRNARGAIALDMGDEAGAEAEFRRIVAAQPGHARAHYNLGVLLARQGHHAAAEQALRKAIECDPALSEAYNNLGMLLHDRGEKMAAGQAFGQAVALRPDNTPALSNLADNLAEANQPAQAETLYRRILAWEPENAHALAALANVLARQWRWADLAQVEHDLTAKLAANPETRVPPFELLRVAEVTPHMLRNAARVHAAEKYRASLATPPLSSGLLRIPQKRIRIGYLSADIHEHATMHLFAGVLEAHDRAAFEIVIYSYGPASDGQARQRAVRAVDRFVECAGWGDRDIAERIAADEIDILVDLKGYTQNGRLAISAYRPAPIIVSWLGYPGTLGEARLADYLIGDPVVTPVDYAAYYSETLALMPHCYQPNDRNRAIGPTPSRAEAGLPESGLVFCSFNQAYKLGPEMFDTWCALLREVPGSVLWLLDPGPEARANLAREAKARGVAAERLVYAGKLPLAAHLARLGLADLALDTYPYTSHTTGSDALWAGVPMLTRMGETFASRVGASLLRAVGLDELVTTTQADYQRLALALATDAPRLAAVRARLAENRQSAPLFDTERFTRDLEALYAAILKQQAFGASGPIVMETAQ